MSIIARLKGEGPSGFGYGSTAEEVTEGIDLRGKNMLVTGCNSGLGQETVRVFGKRGARVFATARSVEKASRACSAYQGDIVPLACELSEPASVRACVEAVAKDGALLDAIVCNAGIMALPTLKQVYGYELQFFTNHIGHFILVTGLMSRLADRARVVILSSSAHASAPKGGIQFDNLSGERHYDGWKAYGQSKVANLLFARELARRLPGRSANGVHPGVIRTNLARSMSPLVRIGLAVANPVGLKSVQQGAATQCYVACHPAVEGVTGEYFADCNLERSTRTSQDPALAARLWEESERIVARLS